MKILKVILIILIVILVGIGITDYFIPDSNFIQDYARGIFTETVGIILTVILFEILLENSRKQENKRSAEKEIKRVYDVLNIYLKEYEKATFFLIYKSEDFEKQLEVGLESDFPFNNLSQIFDPSVSFIDSLCKSKIELYFEKLDNLNEIINTIVLRSDLTNNPELSELLLDHIKYIQEYYPKTGLLNMLGNEKLKKLMIKIIEEHSGPVEHQKSNLKNSFVRLYDIINYNIQFSVKLKALVNQ